MVYIFTFAFIQIIFVQLTSAGLNLHVGHDQLILSSRSQIYQLQLTLDFVVDETVTVAEFNRDTKVGFKFDCF